jgi:hypothetical protein
MIPGRVATESAEYRKLRDELVEAEIALKDQRERVAALRRKLPLDTEIQDYVGGRIQWRGSSSAPKRELRHHRADWNPGVARLGKRAQLARIAIGVE